MTEAEEMNIRVALDVSILSGGSYGGIEQFIEGLVGGLRQTQGEEDFVLVTDPVDPHWIKSAAGPSMQIVMRNNPLAWLRQTCSCIDKRLNYSKWPWLEKLKSGGSKKGFYRSLRADVVHYTYQTYTRTGSATVFNPHDLQHEEFPQFFSEKALTNRRRIYYRGCSEADAIDVPSMYTKRQIVSTYNIRSEKVYVIPRGAPTSLQKYSSSLNTAEVRKKYDLPTGFVFYPAKSWPHKNHIQLIEALVRLKNRKNIILPLVCTGGRTDHWRKVEEYAEQRKFRSYVHHLGYIPGGELRQLYRAALLVALPSLVEGGGFPLLEAWTEGAPVVCSSTTALGEKAKDAAVLCNPEDPDDIASRLYWVARDAKVRNDLSRKGSRRVSKYKWKSTALCYRALYRYVAGVGLASKEKDILTAARKGQVVEKGGWGDT